MAKQIVLLAMVGAGAPTIRGSVSEDESVLVAMTIGVEVLASPAEEVERASASVLVAMKLAPSRIADGRGSVLEGGS